MHRDCKRRVQLLLALWIALAGAGFAAAQPKKQILEKCEFTAPGPVVKVSMVALLSCHYRQQGSYANSPHTAPRHHCTMRYTHTTVMPLVSAVQQLKSGPNRDKTAPTGDVVPANRTHNGTTTQRPLSNNATNNATTGGSTAGNITTTTTGVVASTTSCLSKNSMLPGAWRGCMSQCKQTHMDNV